MGSSSLTSHRKGKNYDFKVMQRNLLIFLNQVEKHNLQTFRAPKGLDTNTQSNSYVQPAALVISEIGDKLCTKIRWVLKHVLKGYSNNSCQDTVSMLKSMFSESKIAEKMELGPSKLKYLVNHGLAPYFKEFLSDDILKSKYFVVSLMEA